jgi:hypothetical protein
MCNLEHVDRTEAEPSGDVGFRVGGQEHVDRPVGRQEDDCVVVGVVVRPPLARRPEGTQRQLPDTEHVAGANDLDDCSPLAGRCEGAISILGRHRETRIDHTRHLE